MLSMATVLDGTRSHRTGAFHDEERRKELPSGRGSNCVVSSKSM